MAIASRQLSRLRQRTQELKAQEQTLQRETEMLKAQEQTLKRETETLKAQEQTLQHETEMLKNLLFTIESEKSKTPKKENFTLNSLHSSLGPKTREAIEGAIDNLFLQHKIRNATIWQSGFPIGSLIPAEVAMRVINKSRFIVYKSMLERLVDKTVTVQRRAVRDTLADALKERVFELSEFDEYAIVSKRAQVVEEVNLAKQAETRDKTVTETVRRSHVHAERVDADGKVFI
jgi:hypothetical protein